MTPFAIAGMQLHVRADAPNFDYISAKIDRLMNLFPWVQMVLCSELATFGPLTAGAVALPGAIEARYQEVASRHGVWLLPGTFFEKTAGGAIYNTAPVISPTGAVIARYRKMFPFLPYEAGVEGGTDFVVFDVPDAGRFGVSICYDMWFPETTRTLAALGAEVILHPTMTTTIDREVELAIAQAAAACNQCFVFDINGCGDGGNGQSVIVGPAGEVLYQAGCDEQMIPLEIDIERVHRSREVGLRGLGQPLKSFRDRKVDFTVYDRSRRENLNYFKTLGALAKPIRGSHAGLENNRKTNPAAAAGSVGSSGRVES